MSNNTAPNAFRVYGAPVCDFDPSRLRRHAVRQAAYSWGRRVARVGIVDSRSSGLGLAATSLIGYIASRHVSETTVRASGNEESMTKSIRDLENLLEKIEGEENQTDRRTAIKAEIERLKAEEPED